MSSSKKSAKQATYMLSFPVDADKAVSNLVESAVFTLNEELDSSSYQVDLARLKRQGLSTQRIEQLRMLAELVSDKPYYGILDLDIPEFSTERATAILDALPLTKILPSWDAVADLMQQDLELSVKDAVLVLNRPELDEVVKDALASAARDRARRNSAVADRVREAKKLLEAQGYSCVKKPKPAVKKPAAKRASER